MGILPFAGSLFVWLLLVAVQICSVALVVWFAITFARMRRDQEALLRLVRSIEAQLRRREL
jgi:hypothetical protein